MMGFLLLKKPWFYWGEENLSEWNVHKTGFSSRKLIFKRTTLTISVWNDLGLLPVRNCGPYLKVKKPTTLTGMSGCKILKGPVNVSLSCRLHNWVHIRLSASITQWGSVAHEHVVSMASPYSPECRMCSFWGLHWPWRAFLFMTYNTVRSIRQIHKTIILITKFCCRMKVSLILK